jgi:hypothetical protein
MASGARGRVILDLRVSWYVLYVRVLRKLVRAYGARIQPRGTEVLSTAGGQVLLQAQVVEVR